MRSLFLLAMVCSACTLTSRAAAPTPPAAKASSNDVLSIPVDGFEFSMDVQPGAAHPDGTIDFHDGLMKMTDADVQELVAKNPDRRVVLEQNKSQVLATVSEAWKRDLGPVRSAVVTGPGVVVVGFALDVPPELAKADQDTVLYASTLVGHHVLELTTFVPAAQAKDRLAELMSLLAKAKITPAAR